MADVSQIYKQVWKGEMNPAEAAMQASEIYTQAAQESAESSCFRGAVTYNNGVAVAANFGKFRNCGRTFGARVAKSSKAGKA